VSAGAAVVRLDRARAESLTRELRGALDLAVGLVRELHTFEGWRAMGYDSWPAFCRAELPQLAVIVKGMPRPERDAKLAELRGAGMSLRDVAEVAGVSPNTVKAAARDAGVVLELVKSRDGAMRPASSSTPAPATRRRPITDRLVEVVADAGPGGVTARDVARRSRLREAQVGPALCRLAAAGRLVYLRPAKRGQVGRYAAL
jgi:hypothetical protein